MDISFITACKNRLHHLKETLPLMVAQQPFEIIVVDYGCPQGTGNWVREHFPAVKVVDVNDDPGFCLARARNLGAAAATGDWLVFIDADVQIQDHWIEWMRAHLQFPWYYRASRTTDTFDPETFGTFICPAEAFRLVKGYDEIFRGWGGEDTDIYNRLKMLGFPMTYYPYNFLSAIPHEDNERVVYANFKNKDIHHLINQTYSHVKYQVMQMFEVVGDLPLKIRERIMKKILLSLNEWINNKNEKLFAIDFEFSGKGWLPDSYKMKKKVSVSFEISFSEDN